VGARIRATEGSAGIAAHTADIAGPVVVRRAVARTAAEAVVAHIPVVRRIVGGAALAEVRHTLLVAAVVHKAAEVVVVRILAVRRIVGGAALAEARHKLLAAAVAHMAAEGVVARIPAVRRMVGEAAEPHTAGKMAHRRVVGQEEHRTADAAAARRTAGEEAVAGSSRLAEGVLIRSAMAPPISQRTVSLLTAVGRVLLVRHFEEPLFVTMGSYSVLLGRGIWKVAIPSVGGERLLNVQVRTSRRVGGGRGSFL
jgi:hypothetical protein